MGRIDAEQDDASTKKSAKLLFATYHGSFTATDAPDYADMMHDVDELHVGGFINITQSSPLGIVKSQAYPTAVLSNQLQANSKLPLLVGADFERGTAMRLDEGTSFPTAMALAAAGNPEDAYTMGKITALEARAVGIHWIYAPVSDVNNNPGNPIINTRSFGEDPQRVAEYVDRIRARRAKKMAASPPQNISPATATPRPIRTSISRSFARIASASRTWNSFPSAPRLPPARTAS